MSDQILVEGLCSEQDMLVVGCSGLSTSHEVEKTKIDLHKEIVHGSFEVQVSGISKALTNLQRTRSPSFPRLSSPLGHA
jgi:hypothetical protein